MKPILLILFSFFFVSQNSIENDLRDYLLKRFSDYEKLEFEIASNIKLSSIEGIDYSREYSVNKNIVTIPIFLKKNKTTTNSYLSVKIKLYKTVFVADENIDRNEILFNNNFRKELKDISILNGTPITELDNNSGLVSKLYIRQGSILLREMTEGVPDIEINQHVTLHAGKNGVDISLDVTSREKGFIGDVIRVVTPENKILKAKIIDKNNVVIEE
ncbi:MAG: flagellar basal body P-ring formation chaperone FlgA [Melioribacteraceae bacterium]|nr:flagellar basal body P-ring formation chaperone FlgA [Melioribacteraceae bacterium]